MIVVQRPLELVDAAGKKHITWREPARILSLVPSLSETLIEMGLHGALVPYQSNDNFTQPTIEKDLRGDLLKRIDIDRIRDLVPTHLIINLDEQTKPAIELLEKFIPNVVTVSPKDPIDNIDLFRLIGGIFNRNTKAALLCEQFAEAYYALVKTCQKRVRQKTLYLVWKSPWLTVNENTYTARMLALAGYEVVDANNAETYPEVNIDQQSLSEINLVLLARTPYRFRDEDFLEVRKLCKREVNVEILDGTILSWYGSRAIQGLHYLNQLRIKLDGVSEAL